MVNIKCGFSFTCIMHVDLPDSIKLLPEKKSLTMGPYFIALHFKKSVPPLDYIFSKQDRKLLSDDVS